MKFFGLLIVMPFLLLSNVNAQESVADTLDIKLDKEHSPKKAALLSAAFPGLGQAYNKKYWKMPIVYAALGTSLYFAFSNNSDFKTFKTAFGLRIDGDPTTIDEFDLTESTTPLTEASLESNLDFHRRNRDLSFILAGLFYALNIVDASVDAHLFTFPKNKSLSFNLQPSLQLTQNNKLVNSISLVIKL